MKQAGDRQGDEAAALPGQKFAEPQLSLYGADIAEAPGGDRNGKANKLAPEDRPFHDWYRFVLSYPPHLVRHYLRDFGLSATRTVLDPFCGTGTTLVEAKRCGIPSVGLEANPFAHFASAVKTDWDIDAGALEAAAGDIAARALDDPGRQGLRDEGRDVWRGDPAGLRRLDPEAEKLLLAGSISPLPLHKTLALLDRIREREAEHGYRHMLLALANALVFSISNLHFGPEVGAGKPKADAPVVSAWLREIRKMAGDLRQAAGRVAPAAVAHLADSRSIHEVVACESIDGVITSPPYPNEKDYTRTTRLESVILGFIRSKAELRALKQRLVRSNTRNVYKGDDDDAWVAAHPEVHRIAEEIERRRIELGKDSGFERLYGRVTRLYFGGMARHLADLRIVLRPGARLAYVVGDQASYLRVMIRTGQLLGEIAQALGYELLRIDLFRTRFATATREQLREEVVVLRWQGP